MKRLKISQYIETTGKQKKPIKFIVSKILIRLKCSHVFSFKYKHHYLKFFPTFLSRILWVDPDYGHSGSKTEDFIWNYLEDGNIFVDVGANIGYYTLLMAKNEANVFSYEPEPQNFELLKKNVRLNDLSTNVKLYNKAVSNFNGNSKLALAEHTTGQHKLGTNRFGNETINVEVIKLELDKIDFAKIDVEGDELHVLQGMKTLPNKMLVEFNSINLKESGSNHKDFFHFIEKYTIKQISKNGLAEPDYDQLIKNKMATNLFLY